MVDDALAHRETGRIPHMILCDPTIGRALADRRGVADVETILSNAVAWIGDRLSGARLRELGLLREGEHTDEWGVRWFGVGETRGQVKAHPLSEPSLEGYRFPDALVPEVLQQMKSQSAANRARYRLAKLGALWEQATFLRGMVPLLEDLILHPAFVHELLDRITDSLLARLAVYRQVLEAECMWLSDDYGAQSQLLMSPDAWREFIRPRLARITEAVHEAGFQFVLHSDGAIGPVIPELVELGVDLLHPVQSECVDVHWVKREFGRHLTIFGGYGSQGTLVHGSPAQVRREVDALCDTLGTGGGFILSPGLTIQNETPVENALAFIDAANAWEAGGDR